MTHATPIFVYWEGSRSPIIDLCIRSIQRWNPSTVVLDPEGVRNLGGSHILDQTEGINPAYRSDLLRAWLLHEFGGVWVDADCIATGPLDFLNQLHQWDLVGVHNPYQNKGWGQDGILAVPVGGRKGSPLWKQAQKMVEDAIGQMKQGKKVSYGYTSVGVASQLYRSHHASPSVRRFDHWRYNPVPWYRIREVMFRSAKPYGHEFGWWNPNACLWHLTNIVTKTWADRTQDQLLSGPSFTSFLFQKAFSRRPAIFGRSAEILRRLPAGPCQATEVGVFRGMNARHLLQQRKDLTLTLVDQWGTGIQESYRKTKDGQVFLTEKQWGTIWRELSGKYLKSFPDRWSALRMDSTQASRRVPDQSQDLIFIDGDHSYDGVKRDLKSWVGKVKIGGYIGGHDYGHPREGKAYGVKRAVDEMAKDLGLPVETGMDWTWFIKLTA